MESIYKEEKDKLERLRHKLIYDFNTSDNPIELIQKVRDVKIIDEDIYEALMLMHSERNTNDQFTKKMWINSINTMIDIKFGIIEKSEARIKELELEIGKNEKWFSPRSIKGLALSISFILILLFSFIKIDKDSAKTLFEGINNFRDTVERESSPKSEDK